jgi:hypothetical protein
VSNKSPISSVSLDRGLAGEFSGNKLLMLVGKYVERMQQITDEDLAYIPWARPLVESMIEIFSEVEASRRIQA